MSLSAIRVAVARENIEETQLTPEEQLMVAPPDEAAQDPDVALAVQEDEQAVSVDDIGQLLDDGEAIYEVVEAVRAEGEDIKPETVIVAQERLNQIGARYGFAKRKISRESFETAGPFSEAQDLIAEAEQNLEYIKVAANEGLKEFVNRIAVNTKNMFRWSSTYAKEARAVAAAAAKTTGTPSSAVYNNRLRIAHFTDAEKNPLTTASEVKKAVGEMSATIVGLDKITEQLGSVFTIFNKGDGRVDLKAIFGRLKATTDSKGNPALSITGTAALFGEEYVISGGQPDVVASSLKEFVEAVAHMKIDYVEHWKVKDLPAEINLPVMSAKEVASNAQGLIALASELVRDYAVVAAMLGEVQQGGSTWQEQLTQLALDAASNVSMVKYRSKISNLIAGLAFAADNAINNKAKALNCLMDYYKWSLKHHTAAATESHAEEQKPVVATEGFAGAVVGFILGGAASAIPVLGGAASGAVMRNEADKLKKEILLVSRDIEKLRRDGSKAAFDDKLITKEMYDAQVGISSQAIIEGAVLGIIFPGIYGAVQGSRIQDRQKELDEKLKELNILLSAK